MPRWGDVRVVPLARRTCSWLSWKRELRATPRAKDVDGMTALAFFCLGYGELVIVLLAALWALLGPKSDRDDASED